MSDFRENPSAPLVMSDCLGWQCLYRHDHVAPARTHNVDRRQRPWYS